jgi:hypothetical protein
MADLWLFLNDGITRADLYRELFGWKPHQKVDHRIFNGKIKTVDGKIEHLMRLEISRWRVSIGRSWNQWLVEFEALSHSDWVPYSRIRPALVYLWEKLGVHPTSLLHQSVVRYESGVLKRVSQEHCGSH